MTIDRSQQGASAASASTPPKRSSCIATRRRRCSASWPTPSARASIPTGVVTYIIDRNVNYTNVCVAKCNFCAFYRAVGSPEGYVLGFDELFRKIDETIAVGGVQLLLQGGHNPDLPLTWYEDLFRAIKQRYPSFKLHALSPPEVIHLSRLSQLPVPAVIDRLIAAGLDSIPGGGAEILVDRVRKLLHCYGKATADEWLDVMRHAHRAGLRTTATMMYGTVETDEERLEHLLRLRALQDETGGFTAFITWSYQPDHTELAGSEATGIDYLRTLAIARIVLDNFDNLQASWVTQGGKVGQLSLAYGANDMGSVMIEENVVRAAGASYCMDEVEIVRNIEDAGFAAKRRNMHYEILGDPIFREREVPRMLELATARADGDMQRARGAALTIRRAAGTRQTQAATIAPAIDPLPRRLDSADQRAADSRRLGRRRSRPHRRARSAGRPASRAADGARVVDLGDVAVLPGLVNAHTHLELSYLRDEVPPASQFVTWIRGVMAARRERPDPGGAGDPRRASIARIAESVRVRHGGRRRHQQHARHVRAAGAQPARRRRVLRADPVQRAGSGGARRRSALQQIDGAAADRARARQPRRARAVFGGAAACFARSARRSIAIRSRRAASTCPSRPRKSSSSAPAAGRGARCSRRSASWDPAWVAAGRARRCSFSTRAVFSTTACSRSTACR